MRSLPARGVTGLSFVFALAIYAAGIAFASSIVGYGAHRMMQALAAVVPTTDKAVAQNAAKPAPSKPQTEVAASVIQVVREASMTPTQDRGFRPSWQRERRDDRNLQRSAFGSSSRASHQPRGFFERLFGGDGWDRPSETYRTVCVRLCDGYYFPVSFSAGPERFERDARACESSCGSQGRLFVYRNPGGDIEDMHDLQGRRYRDLRTAYLYRAEYVSDCKCKPHPWEQEATDRHRTYALAAAKRKGSKTAAAELSALESKMREDAKARQAAGRAAKTASLAPRPEPHDRASTGVSAVPQQPRPIDGEAMRLGADARKAKAQQQDQKKKRYTQQDSDWARRTVWRDF